MTLPLLVLGGIGYFLYRRNQQSTSFRQATQTWASTAGMILTSSIRVSRTGRSRSEIPVIVFQYEVHGRKYQNQTVRAGEQFLSARVAGQAQATVNRYPSGAGVTVYYNPVNPAESALER